ncbi:CD209 antigen-like protein 2 isoform X2 [Paroedura picta]|uniref:CD209 antigen-like protein 2 isoform X2 n=1 Tax=Paroedura picta TaxID=143630 RepID=UPI004055CFB9
MPPKENAPDKTGKDAKDAKGTAPAAPAAPPEPTEFNLLLMNPRFKYVTMGVTGLVIFTTLLVFLLYCIYVDKATQIIGAVSSMRGVLSYHNESYDLLPDKEIMATMENLLVIFVNQERMNKRAQHEIDQITKLLDKGWMPFGGFLFYFSPGTGQNQDTAVKACEATESTLAYIQSQEEEAFLESVATTNKKRYWIGLTKPSNHWEWITGEKLTTAYWAAGSPSASENSPKTCVEIQGGAPKLHAWGDVLCALTKNWICKLTPDPELSRIRP